MSSRRRMPPEWVATFRPSASVSEKRSSRSSAIAPGLSRCRSRATSTRFSRPVRISSTAANCPVRLKDSRTFPGFAATSKPFTVTVPASPLSSVERIFTRVVLPAPFAEQSENAPPGHVEVDAAQYLEVFEVLLQALDVDRRPLNLTACHLEIPSRCRHDWSPVARLMASVRRARSLSIHRVPP
jgi:hypothetical protein